MKYLVNGHQDFVSGNGLFHVRIHPSGPFFFVWGIGDDDICRMPDIIKGEAVDIFVQDPDAPVHPIG